MPIDTSIYRSNPLRSVADYEKELTDAQTSRQQVGLNKLALDAGRMKQDEYQRGIQKTNALQAITSNFGPDPELNAQLLVQKGYVPEAQKYRENEYDIAKKRADSVKVMADALDKKIQQHQGLLSQVQNPQMAAQWMQAAYQDPDLGKIVSRLGPPEEAIKSIPQDSQGFQNWILQASAGSEKLRAQLAAEARDAEAKANNLRTDTRARDIAAANNAVQIRGQNVSAGTAAQRLEFDKTKDQLDRTQPKQKAVGPMSVTLQKELIESDDAVATNKSVKATLEAALKLNDTAYSGIGAKSRAVIRSNVPGIGGSDAANATIDLDNMMTGQALESLKAVFGGMPTEGERKILLDMQASADKTPAQRKSIIERAISAADRRAIMAESKAKAIREGTYLTEGAKVPEPAKQENKPSVSNW